MLDSQFFQTRDPELDFQNVEFAGIGTVRIRKINQFQFSEVSDWVNEKPDEREKFFNLKLISVATEDTHGKPLIVESQFNDAIKNRKPSTFSRLANWIIDVSPIEQQGDLEKK